MFLFRLSPLLLAVIFTATPAHTASWQGPIPMRNHHPLYAGLLYPPPEDGNIAPDTRWGMDINHTNIFMKGKRGPWAVDIDKELTQLDLSVRAPLAGGKAQAGISAPFYYSSGGLLDGFVRWYHQGIGIRGYDGQSQVPDYSFSNNLFHDGKKLMSGGGNRISLGDTTIWIKIKIAEGDNYGASFQAQAQAPTGSPDEGTGSGGWEFGARLLASVMRGNNVAHVGLGLTRPGALNYTSETIPLDPMIAGFAAWEYLYSARLSLLAQTMFNSSPMSRSTLITYGKPWVEVTFGLKYRLSGRYAVSAGFSENLNHTAPDFTIQISFGGSMRRHRNAQTGDTAPNAGS